MLDPLGLFHNPCDTCATNSQQCCTTQGRCCHTQTFPGQFAGQVPGHFPGHHGQQSGFIPGQHPGQIPGQFPGQFPGQIPGQFPGQFPGQLPGQFPGQGGQFGSHGFKGGVCPVSGGLHTGFHRFGGGPPCVQECQSDLHCPDVRKCCPIGCSFACRNPQGGKSTVIRHLILI